jgi:nitrate/nitrite transporter NarK
MTIGGFGGTLGSIFIGRLIDSKGYASTIRYVAILVVVVTVVVWLLARNYPSDVNTTMLWAKDEAEATKKVEDMPGIMLKDAIKTYNFWALAVFFVLFAACFYAAYANVAVYMADMGLSATTYGAIFSVVLTVNNITMIPGGFVADKLGARLSLTVVAVLYAIVAFVLGFTTPTVNMMYVVCGLIGLAFLFPKILPTPMVRQAFGVKDAAAIQGIFTACITIGAMIGTPIANVVYDLTGSYVGLFKSLLPTIVICIILGVTGAKKVKGWEE